MPQQAFPLNQIDEFKTRLRSRMGMLAAEFGIDEFVLPVGLFLLIDRDHGGDATADEVSRRFGLIDFESGNVIDFYFLGWERAPQGDGIQFSLPSFHSFRTALKQRGIGHFGGNADLILVDAVRGADGEVELEFSQAVHLDLSRLAAEKNFPTVGGLLQSIIEAANGVRASRGAGADGAVFSISDRLGVAIARNSLLGIFLDRFGKLIGAKQLAAVATRNLGPAVRLNDF